jgi:hypothetical protein
LRFNLQGGEDSFVVSVFSIDSRVSSVGEHDFGGKNEAVVKWRGTVGASGIAGWSASVGCAREPVDFSEVSALAIGKNAEHMCRNFSR